MTAPEPAALSPSVYVVPTRLANAYLWRHGRDVTLVDTGLVGDDILVLDAMRSLGMSGDELVRIVLTHWHEDHAGGAAALAERTGAQVCAARADAPVIRGEQGGAPPVLTPAEERLMADLADQVVPAPPCRVDRQLDDGATLDTGAGPAAVVLATPGHAPGSIALHLPGERVVLTGDVAAHQQGQVMLGPFNTDRELASSSLRRLAGLDVDAAGFGHGPPVTRDAAAALAAWVDPFVQDAGGDQPSS